MTQHSSGPGGRGQGGGDPREPFFGRRNQRQSDEAAVAEDLYFEERDADGRFAAQSRYSDVDTEPYDEGYYEDFDETNDEGGRRGGWAEFGLIKVAIAGAALILFAGVVWYAYSLGRGDFAENGELPVIAANPEPERVRPENPGGLTIPHQDKLLLNDRSGQGEETVERLLPAPEQPQIPLREEPPVQEEPIAESEIETRQLDDQAGNQPVSEGAAESETVVEPETEPEAEVEVEPAAEPASETEEPAPPSPPEAPAAPQPSSEPGFVVGSPAGPFAVQLASVSAEERAVQEWERLQAQHPTLLGQSALAVQRVELEGRGVFFRIQAGPFPNRTTAEDICAQLEAADQSCLVVAR